MNFRKFAKRDFSFISSGELKKSFKTAGIIKAYGEPLTKTTTLPFNR